MKFEVDEALSPKLEVRGWRSPKSYSLWHFNQWFASFGTKMLTGVLGLIRRSCRNVYKFTLSVGKVIL